MQTQNYIFYFSGKISGALDVRDVIKWNIISLKSKTSYFLLTKLGSFVELNGEQFEEFKAMYDEYMGDLD